MVQETAENSNTDSKRRNRRSALREKKKEAGDLKDLGLEGIFTEVTVEKHFNNMLILFECLIVGFFVWLFTVMTIIAIISIFFFLEMYFLEVDLLKYFMLKLLFFKLME